MNRKLVISMMTIVMSLQMGGSILASEIQKVTMTDNIMIENVEEQKGKFTAETGEVCTISEDQSGYVLQVGSVEEGTIFNLSENIVVFDVASKGFIKPADIRKGMKVSVVYPKDVPMMLSLPGRCGGAELIIIHSEQENVQIGYFNDDLVNEENTLALNVSEETAIMNTRGERRQFVADDIKGKDAMVVYSVTTRSIPAQTTPSFVLIMESNNEEEGSAELSKVKPSENPNIVYVSLRTLAEQNGFKVSWDNSNKTVMLTKENEEYSLTVGENIYFYNKEERMLEYPIILKDGNVEIADEIFIK